MGARLILLNQYSDQIILQQHFLKAIRIYSRGHDDMFELVRAIKV